MQMPVPLLVESAPSPQVAACDGSLHGHAQGNDLVTNDPFNVGHATWLAVFSLLLCSLHATSMKTRISFKMEPALSPSTPIAMTQS